MEDVTEKVWTISVDISETENDTQATVHLTVGDKTYGGWGRARRNPEDPSVPRVGEELAAARALSDLAHHLIDDVAGEIERFEGGPVSIHP
jgi:hypothetical protein